jgi:hypothetical protein
MRSIQAVPQVHSSLKQTGVATAALPGSHPRSRHPQSSQAARQLPLQTSVANQAAHHVQQQQLLLLLPPWLRQSFRLGETVVVVTGRTRPRLVQLLLLLRVGPQGREQVLVALEW